MSKLTAIEGYERYYATESGDIYSYKYNRRVKLKPRLNRKGYLYVNLYKNGKMKSITVHRLIAKTLLVGFDPLMQVNHIDADKTNNSLSNLEMVTRLENIRHAMDLGLITPITGEDHWCAKLTESDVCEIREKYKPRTYTQRMLAKEYGVSRGAIGAILNNRTWKSVL